MFLLYSVNVYDPKKKSISDIFTLIKTTWKTPYLSMQSGTYAIFKRKFNYEEVDHSDGIGTKGIYHWNKKTYHEAVIDSLAMNLNDLLLVRATAYKLQNHLVLPRDDARIIGTIISYLSDECKSRQIAITGGETSIHNLPDSFDIGISISGFIKTKSVNKAQMGDFVIGLKSSGLHSNGFTLVRKLFKSYRPEFTQPTKIYYDDLKDLVISKKIHGMMHITGGAFSKLHGIMISDMDIVLDGMPIIKPQKIFYDIYSKGLKNKQMYTTFNCGVGFILTLEESSVSSFLKKIPYATVIGKVVKGNGKILLTSSFDKKKVTL